MMRRTTLDQRSGRETIEDDYIEPAQAESGINTATRHAMDLHTKARTLASRLFHEKFEYMILGMLVILLACSLSTRKTSIYNIIALLIMFGIATMDIFFLKERRGSFVQAILILLAFANLAALGFGAYIRTPMCVLLIRALILMISSEMAVRSRS